MSNHVRHNMQETHNNFVGGQAVGLAIADRCIEKHPQLPPKISAENKHRRNRLIMNKCIAWISVFVISLGAFQSTLLAQTPKAEKNLVKNPGFELSPRPNSWTLQTSSISCGESNARFSIDDSVAASGKRSCKISGLTFKTRDPRSKFCIAKLMSEPIKIDKDKTYTASVMMKMSKNCKGIGVRGYVKGYLPIDNNNNGMGAIGFDFACPKGTDEWRSGVVICQEWDTISEHVKLDWNKVQLFICIYIYEDQPEDACIWIDDISFTLCQELKPIK